MAVVTHFAAAARGFELWVDDTPAGVVSLDLVARWALCQGREFDDEELSRLLDEIAAESALADARALLRHRVRSQAEVERRLAAAGHTVEIIAIAVERLAAAGLIDDVDFARRYIADKRDLSGWGEVRVRRGLSQLGVDGDIIARALGDPGDHEASEFDRALAHLVRKGAPQGSLQAAKRRAYQALLRRGFAASVSAAAVRRWADDASPEAL